VPGWVTQSATSNVVWHAFLFSSDYTTSLHSVGLVKIIP